MSVRTIYELNVLTKIPGYSVFGEPVRRYDELQSDLATQHYNREVSRAKAQVGKSREIMTYGGTEITGVVEQVVVELWAFKTNGEGWNSERRIVGEDFANGHEGRRVVFTIDKPEEASA